MIYLFTITKEFVKISHANMFYGDYWYHKGEIHIFDDNMRLYVGKIRKDNTITYSEGVFANIIPHIEEKIYQEDIFEDEQIADIILSKIIDNI
jgi:hypothetical protein